MLLDLTEIQTYVKAEFNQSDNNSFISNVEINRWANEGLMRYAHQLMQASQGYFEIKINLDLVANTEAVALPSYFNVTEKSHFGTIRLERNLPSATIPLQFRRRRDISNPSTGITGLTFLPTYDFRGNNIILEPAPTSAETNGLILVYQFMPPRLQSGTAQAGAATTITLDATADPRDDYYNDQRIFISSGTGLGQIRTISDYVGSSKVATVSVAWGTNPDSTSVFSTLIHDDFPESFHELLPLYATKKAFLKERSRGVALSYDAQSLKDLEEQFRRFLDSRTEARKFVQPFHLELDGPVYG